jgi:gamma-glutamylaminecyclotransferase
VLHRLFVYGTLKEGFRNFHVNRGRRVAGDFVTVEHFPLYVIGDFGLPWLVHEPGQGHRITGQLFEVDDAGLADMDTLERIHEPGWYARWPVLVTPAGGGAPIEAQAYFGDAIQLTRATVHHGPLPRYDADLQALYRKHLQAADPCG